jgi:WD40 repeat protein
MDTKELLKKYEPAKKATALTAKQQVRLARYSPCGKVLAAGGFDGLVRRWNVEGEAAEMPPLEGHHAWIDGLAFRGEGELLFTGDSWGQLRCWKGYTAEQPELAWKNEQAHDGWIRDCGASPGGQVVASCGSDGCLRLWDAAGGKLVAEMAKYGRDLLRLAWLPDGTLLTGDDRGIVKHWKEDGTLLREFDASVLYSLSRLQDCGGVHALAVDREGKRLAAGGLTPKNGGTVVGPPTLLVFDVGSGKEVQRWKLGADNDAFVGDVHFHDEGFLSVVTYGTPGAGKLLYVAAGEEAPFFEKKLSNAHSLSWHPSGKSVAVLTTAPGSNGNGRPLDKEGNYKGNTSPIQVFGVGG